MALEHAEREETTKNTHLLLLCYVVIFFILCFVFAIFLT